ncbi:MAG TPA: helix-hairpin-helix domain-containing protein [Bacteroidales bacterium]|nr:helix-hairpin-helix domain-containing protein [Bacteroidales bacterium]
MTKPNQYIKIFSRVFLLVMLVLCCMPVFAQEVEPDSTVDEQFQQKIENYSEQTEAEIDYTDMLADLEYFLKHPVNINNAGYDELAALKIMNDIQINNLLNHIQKNGKLLSVYELQSVNGFDAELITQLLPYIKIGAESEKQAFNFKDLFKYGKHDVIIRYQRVLEKQHGYIKETDTAGNVIPGSHYLGSPDKLYLKYRYNYFNKVLWGFTAEKDAGEQFFKGTNPYGFDYYSGFVNVRNIGILKNIVLGDFNIQFGQGLTLWTGLSFGKGSEPVNIKKIARGISPYSSAYETGFMRGAGVTFGFKNFELTGFYSKRNIDGSINGSDTMENTDYYISSITEDGLHNTQSKADKKHAINQQVYGGHLAYKTRSLNIGITAYGLHLDAELIKTPKPYNVFDFKGQDNFNIGIDYSYIFRNFNIFGETSRSSNEYNKKGGIATFNGIMVSLDRYVSLVVAYRYYQRNYQSLFASPFGESGNPYNESGFYTGISIKPHYRLLINANADFYTYSWLKYQVNSPSNGFDCNVGLQYKPTKKITINLRYKYENKVSNSDDEEAAIDYNVPYTRQNYRFHISYPVSSSFTFSNRVEVSRYKNNTTEPEYGYLLYQDIRYKSITFPLAASFRFALFDTKSYDSRMYTYENDVLYAYSIPMFYDKGIRYYVMLKYKISRNIDIWLRFAQTFYNSRSVISSGLNEINGNKQSEIKAQVRFKF